MKYLEFSVIFIFTLSITIILFYKHSNEFWRTAILISNLGLFLYSGFGFIIYSMEIRYLVAYILSCIFLNLGIYLGWGSIYQKKYIHILDENTIIKETKIGCLIRKNFNIIKAFTVLYFIIKIIGFFYPVNKFSNFSIATIFSIQKAINSQYEDGSSSIQHLFSTISIILEPFAYIYFFNKKKSTTIVFLISVFVFQYIDSNGYLGRRNIVILVIMIFLYLYSKERNKNNKKKLILISIPIALLLIWMYAVFKYIRSGIIIDTLNYGLKNSFLDLIFDEFSYAKHYPFTEYLYKNGIYPAKKFWYWLLTISIPKSIFSIPNYDIKNIIIYRVFSYNYFGGLWGDEGVGGVLPSIVGEGIMLYGPFGAFILIIPAAIFIGAFIHFLSDNSEFKLYLYMIIITIFLGFRAGSQYLLALINNWISILIGIVMIIMINEIKRNIKKSYE